MSLFLLSSQEIDAITTQPSSEDASANPSAPASTPPKPEVNTQQPGASEGQQSTEYNTQYSLAGGKCLRITAEIKTLCKNNILA